MHFSSLFVVSYLTRFMLCQCVVSIIVIHNLDKSCRLSEYTCNMLFTHHSFLWVVCDNLLYICQAISKMLFTCIRCRYR